MFMKIQVLKRIGDFVNDTVREEGMDISFDEYVFAHNADQYLIWKRLSGEIIWIGAPGVLGELGYRAAFDECRLLNKG